MMPTHEEILYWRLLRSPRILEPNPHERARMVLKWKMIRWAQREVQKQRARKRRR